MTAESSRDGTRNGQAWKCPGGKSTRAFGGREAVKKLTAGNGLSMKGGGEGNLKVRSPL
jgi:hypothetical protein